MRCHRRSPVCEPQSSSSWRATSTRSRALPAIVVAIAVLAACGSDTDTAETPVETTAGVVDTTEPATTSVPEPETGGGWELAADREVPPLQDGKSAPISSPLPDGAYWSWDYVSDGSTVEFTLSQYFTGDACREQFGDGDGACASDNDTLYEPSAKVTMPAGTGSTTVIADNGEAGIDAYRVSPAEFARLVAGEAPASDAPDGFSFQPAAVIVTVRNGEVAAADQVFTS